MFDQPKAPDPYQTASTQQQFNLGSAKQSQELNQYNQSNPFGSTTYSQTGTNPDGTPQYSVSTAFSPTEQAIFNGYTQNQQGAQGAANRILNSGQGAFSGQGPDLSYNGTASALDKLARSQLDPQWNQQQDHLESQLAAQGLNPGSVAYNNAYTNFNNARNSAYNSAYLNDYQTAANNALAQYNAPLQNYEALINGTAPTSPTAGNVSTPTTNVAGTNYAGLVEKNYQNQLQAHNSMLGGLFGLGGTIGGALLGGPLGASAGGALGGLFGGSPSYGGGNFLTDAYGGSASNPLPGLTAADYG